MEKESSTAIHALVDEFEHRLKILKHLGEKTDDCSQSSNRIDLLIGAEDFYRFLFKSDTNR